METASVLTCCLRCCFLLLLLPVGCADPQPPGLLGADKGDQTLALPAQLQGSYLLEVVSTSVYADSKTGEQSTMCTEIRARVEATADEQGSTLSLAPCLLRLPEVSGFEPALSEEALAQLAPVTARVQVRRAPASQELLLASEPFAFPIGLELEDPLHDPVPVNPEDPAVLDLEGDGHPGVTIRIAGFGVYLVARASFELFGLVEQDGQERPRAQGSLNIGMDQQIFGDSIPFVDVAKRVAEIDQTQQLLSAEHSFWLTPTVDTLSCARP